MFQWQQQHKNMQICHSTPLSEKQFQDNGSHLSSNLQTTDDKGRNQSVEAADPTESQSTRYKALSPHRRLLWGR
jgi:outer membrane biogenesis lipoprotein LolB